MSLIRDREGFANNERACEFDFLRMDQCRLSAKLTIPFNCNWKFIVENLMDYYHVGVLHVRSFGARTFFDRARFTQLLGPALAAIEITRRP